MHGKTRQDLYRGKFAWKSLSPQPGAHSSSRPHHGSPTHPACVATSFKQGTLLSSPLPFHKLLFETNWWILHGRRTVIGQDIQRTNHSVRSCLLPLLLHSSYIMLKRAATWNANSLISSMPATWAARTPTF